MAPSKHLSAENLFSLNGMIAVITGGGTGIGLTMAKALLANGARNVYILGRRKEVLDAAAEAHPSLIAVQCDVTDHASLQHAVNYIQSKSSYINLLIANSGVVGPAVGWRPDLSISEIRSLLFTPETMQGMTDTLNVNVTGAFYTMIAFLELLEIGNMISRRGGYGRPDTNEGPGKEVLSVQSHVIFTSSISAFSRSPMSPPPYAASKAAIMHLTKHASSNLARFGIRVNALAPGLFPSDIAQGLIGDRDPSTEDHTDPRFIPAKRFGGDEEIAGTLLYLASRAGAYCNGSVLMMDGGRLAMMPSSY